LGLERGFAGERVEVKLRQALAGRRVFVGWLRAPDAAQTAADGRGGDSSGDSNGSEVFGLEYEVDAGRATVKNARGAARKSVANRGGEPTQLLSFTFDEVERAKLAPVLDFKGKKR